MSSLLGEYLRRHFFDVGARLEELAAQYERELFERELADARRAARAAKRRSSGKIARRVELLAWLESVAHGRASEPCQGYEVGQARRMIGRSTGGLTMVAAKLTGEPRERFQDAQRERRRLGNRRRR